VLKLPDWKDISQYPKAGAVSNDRLAWEFLRRNPEYQKDWRRYLCGLKDAADGDEDLLRTIGILEAEPSEATKLLAEFPSEKERSDAFTRLEDCEPWIEFSEHGQSGRRPLGRDLGVRWGLDYIANPNSNYGFPSAARFVDAKSVRHPSSLGLKKLEVQSMRGNKSLPYSDLARTQWLILQIDLTWPLEVIEETVMRDIRLERDRRGRLGYIELINARARAPAQLVAYLRILDASELKVPKPRIGEVLYPYQDNSPPEYGRDKRIKAAVKAARALRDGGYRVLPLLKDKARARPR